MARPSPRVSPAEKEFEGLRNFCTEPQDNTAVAVGAQETADQCPPMYPGNAHGLEWRLQPPAGAQSQQVFLPPESCVSGLGAGEYAFLTQ